MPISRIRSAPIGLLWSLIYQSYEYEDIGTWTFIVHTSKSLFCMDFPHPYWIPQLQMSMAQIPTNKSLIGNKLLVKYFWSFIVVRHCFNPMLFLMSDILWHYFLFQEVLVEMISGDRSPWPCVGMAFYNSIVGPSCSMLISYVHASRESCEIM